jgi:hypothetical protein
MLRLSIDVPGLGSGIRAGTIAATDGREPN